MKLYSGGLLIIQTSRKEGCIMQEVTKKELKQLIKEAKKAKKDVSELEAALKKITKAKAVSPPMGQKKKKKKKGVTVVIESTGPINEEDFK
jgi:hypothetical protein